MAKRRRRELSAIASLDADVARARQTCEDQVQRVCDRLLERQRARGSAHDAYLECLRSFYEAARADHGVDEQHEWSATALQTFLGRYFVVYREKDAFAGVCAALETEGARWHGDKSDRRVALASFDTLKHALQRDTATRMAEHSAAALTKPIEGLPASVHGRVEEELALPRLAFHGKRPRPSTNSAAARSAPATSTSRSSVSAVQVSQSDVSSVWFDDEDDDSGNEYVVPANSVVIPSEFSAEVVKKSQNWFGRWRTRHLYLRWNELEMRTKNSTVASRHGAARSFPSQPVMSTHLPVAIAAPSTLSAHSSATSVKSKRYALQNLISIQLIQLNESDPSRRHAIDIHFKQTAASGHGHTTKSLILGSEKGVDTLKKIMSSIATLALFRGIVAGERAQQLQRYIQSGANVNAFCSVPSLRFLAPVCPLQLVVLQCYAKPDSQQEFGTMKMLQDSNADVRALLHWHFARRTLLSTHAHSNFSFVELLLPCNASTTGAPVLQMPLSGFGSDEHGWTLLMYLSLLGDVARVSTLLTRIRTSVRERDKIHRYMEHVNGNGDTALHIAIKASGYRRDLPTQSENVAMAMASFTLPDDSTTSQTSSLFYISDGNGQTVMHLAIKARMWRLVELLLQQKLFDTCSRDDYGNNALHLMIKVGAPLSVFELAVQHFKPKARRTSASEDLDSRDQTSNASPMLLSLQRRREDYVTVLLEAGAVVVGPIVSEASALLPGDRAEDHLLHVAIRLGLASSARKMWECLGSRHASIQSTTLSLAVRFGMYHLAFNIIHGSSLRSTALGRYTSWTDTETGFSIATLASIAGEFELVALIVDAGGDFLYGMCHQVSGETLLHALMFSGIKHQPEDPNSCRMTVRPSHSKSLSDGDLLNTNRALDDDEEMWRTALACSTFRLRVVEELLSHGLLALPIGDLLTIACKRINLTFKHAESYPCINHEASKFLDELGESLTLLSMASGDSQGSSSRFLPLLLAVVRIKCAESDQSATFADWIARYTEQDETSVFIALSRGHAHNALLLLHHLLPKTFDQDDERVDICDYHWMEANGTTLLHTACRRPNDHDMLTVIDLLLRMGVYSGGWDSEGFCPLHIAIQNKCDERIVQLFKKYDQDLCVWSDATNTLRVNGEMAAIPLTPLMVAIQHNNVAAFRELILCGAEYRMVVPTYRLGLLHFAARWPQIDRDMVQEVTKLNLAGRNPSKDVYGLSSAEACDMLLSRLEKTGIFSENAEQCEHHTSTTFPAPSEADKTGDNSILRITLLGLQTSSNHHNGNDSRTSVLSSPAMGSGRSSHYAPPLSPSISSSRGDSARSRGTIETSERAQTPPPPRHPFLGDAALGYLLAEEKSTLTLIAQEARNEAQEWLKKRSGQKKLLSEARAHLQATQGHRRTGSGTIVQFPEAQPPVTDAQLLDAYKTLAAKQFIDKHVAQSVAEARLLIDREKRVVFQETGVYPGEIVLSSKGKENSIGSTSSASTRDVTGMHRSASINSSMMLLSSRSNDLSDHGDDSSRGGLESWSGNGEASYDDEGNFLGEIPRLNATWLSSASSGTVAVAHVDDGDETVVNPLECEGFVHVIEKRKSMH